MDFANEKDLEEALQTADVELHGRALYIEKSGDSSRGGGRGRGGRDSRGRGRGGDRGGFGGSRNSFGSQG